MGLRKRYVIACLLIVLLTAGVMLMPNITGRLAERRNGILQIRDIPLADAERSLTAAEVVKLIHNNAANAIFAPTETSVSRTEAQTQCRRLIAELFASYPEITFDLLQLFNSVTADARLECCRFLTLSEGEVVALTLIAYGTADYAIYYEANSGVLLALAANGVPKMDEFTLEEATRSYYIHVGLTGWEFDFGYLPLYWDDENEGYNNAFITVVVNRRLYEDDVLLSMEKSIIYYATPKNGTEIF